MSEKVQALAKKVKKLSPAGQAAVGIVIDAAGIHTDGGNQVQTSIISKHEMIDQINDADWKVAEQKGKVRVAEEMAQDMIEAMPEFKQMEEAQKAYEGAKERFRIACLRNGDLNNQKEIIAQEKRELKWRREIISQLIIRYMADYRVQSVEAHDAPRKLVVTARIGRKLKKQEQGELPL